MVSNQLKSIFLQYSQLPYKQLLTTELHVGDDDFVADLTQHGWVTEQISVSFPFGDTLQETQSVADKLLKINKNKIDAWQDSFHSREHQDD